MPEGRAMVVIAVTYRFPEERADEAAAILGELARASRLEDGCVGYEVARGGGDDRATFVLFEKWRDQAAVGAHQGAEPFVRLGLNGIRRFMTERRAVVGTLVE
jgi:quinol monooxygenase YgiN